MTFKHNIDILFRHCDPAGIVFFPRYFEMINDVMEAFFATIPGHSFAEMHKSHAVPTAKIETEFLKPSYHGDTLVMDLSFERIGRTSAATEYVARCGDEIRLRAKSVLVYVGPDLRPTPWPEGIRKAMQAIQAKG